MDLRKTGPGTKCKVSDCKNQVHAKAYCKTHYAQINRSGQIYRQEEHTPCPMCKGQFTPKNVRDIYCTNECRNLARRLRRHSTSVRVFWKLYEHQNAKCAVCETVLRFSEVRIDHDHRCCNGDSSCGHCVRGLLCHLCNVGIGALGDDAQSMQRALVYLMAWEHPACEVMTGEAFHSHQIWQKLNFRLGAA